MEFHEDSSKAIGLLLRESYTVVVQPKSEDLVLADTVPIPALTVLSTSPSIHFIITPTIPFLTGTSSIRDI